MSLGPISAYVLGGPLAIWQAGNLASPPLASKIISTNNDPFVTPERFRKSSKQIHTNSMERCFDSRHWHQVSRWFLRDWLPSLKFFTVHHIVPYASI
ncbi:hypothetical protein AVEN_75374-1 [Araneus ventricosus]|uniref:Uncharacterized protein n=1 Tax=Araneus ventricosus TaxID=182803 RepID=A0A4Y2WGN9_ARAVE|nr:hypothetical protein AVEN_75374-1 [Araneus ventricosus]